MKWKHYVKPATGPASQDDIERVESVLGVKLPDGFVRVARQHQGQTPELEIIESDELNPVPFGPLLHFLANPTKEQAVYGMLQRREKWIGWYPNLIPIASSGGGASVFAYDYRRDRENPPVVFINSDVPPDDEDAVLFVANSFDELIGNLVA